jgi:hypothetical protein
MKAGHKRRETLRIYTNRKTYQRPRISLKSQKESILPSQTCFLKAITSMRLFVTLFFWGFASGAASVESTIKPTDEPTAEEFDFESRIVGGDIAPQGRYPFFTRWSGCGASLVWKDFLLSAAHVSRTATPSRRVALEATNLSPFSSSLF